MVKLKKFQTEYPIYVDLSIRLVKNGFNFKGVIDLGQVGGICSECGHPIRYEHWYSEKETGEEFSFGSECNYKIYVLLHWQDQIEYKDVESKQLQRAGKWLWILYRDKLITKMNEKEIIPQPKDYIGVDEEGNKTKDFKLLADDMKRLVMKTRSRIKKEIKKEEIVKEKKLKALKQREEEKRGAKEFIKRHEIDLNVCNTKEKTFLTTIYRCERNMWTLSEKQQKWFDDIIKRSKNGINEEPVSKITAVVMELHNKSNLNNANEWELDFIDSVLDQINSGRFLSQKQLNIIEKLEIKVLGVSQGNSIELVHVKEFKTQPIREEPVKQEIKEITNLDGIDYDLTNKYQGRKTKTWVIHEKFSLWTQAMIITVKKETNKAILCNLELQNIENGIRNDVWIPFSQLEETITL